MTTCFAPNTIWMQGFDISSIYRQSVIQYRLSRSLSQASKWLHAPGGPDSRGSRLFRHGSDMIPIRAHLCVMDSRMAVTQLGLEINFRFPSRTAGVPSRCPADAARDRLRTVRCTVLLLNGNSLDRAAHSKTSHSHGSLPFTEPPDGAVPEEPASRPNNDGLSAPTLRGHKGHSGVLQSGHTAINATIFIEGHRQRERKPETRGAESR
jgi:hypothetical protein